MRDLELMMQILEKAAEADGGRHTVSDTYGAGSPKHNYHQVELLVDTGLVEWLGDGNPRMARIRVTALGYDVIAKRSSSTQFMVDLGNKLAKGMPLLAAIKTLLAG